MSLSRSAVTALFLLPVMACAHTAQCPVPPTGAKLASVTVFDGPPDERADLEPDNSVQGPQGTVTSSWDVGYIFQAGRQLYIECEYDHGAKPVLLTPKNVKDCTYTSGPKGTTLTCD